MTIPSKNIILSKDTLIPLGLVVVLITGIVWLQSRLNSIENKIDQIQTRLEIDRVEVDRRIVATQNDIWSKKDQLIWAQKMKIQNGNLNVPTEYIEKQIADLQKLLK